MDIDGDKGRMMINKLKRIIRKLIEQDTVPSEEEVLRSVQRRVGSLPAADALRFLFNLDAYSYALEAQKGMAYEGGLHPKHRLMCYHDFFVQRVRPGERVLDIGCGNGALAYDVAEKGFVDVVGIDLNAANIETAKTHWVHPRVYYVIGDALKDLPQEQFDVVILSNVLEHLPGRIQFLQQVKRVIKPRRMLIRVPLFEREWRVPLKKELGVEWRLDLTHETEYTLESFAEEMMLAGLVIRHQEVRWGEIWAEVYLEEKDHKENSLTIEKINHERHHPLVSVVMSVLNGEKYLGEAIESILSQSFSDFEFVIIDDGSTDLSGEIIHRYTTQDPRILVIKHEEKIGLASSLNEGISLARGIYIARMDADDVSLPQRFQKQVDYLETNKDVGVLGTAAWVIDKEDNTKESILNASEHNFLKWRFCLIDNNILHPSVMMRKDVVIQAGGYNQQYMTSQDYELWSRLIFMTKITNLSEVLFKLRKHGANHSIQHFSKHRINNIRIAEAFMREAIRIPIASRDLELMYDFQWNKGSLTCDDCNRLQSLLELNYKEFVNNTKISKEEKRKIDNDVQGMMDKVELLKRSLPDTQNYRDILRYYALGKLKRKILDRPYAHGQGFGWLISLPELNNIADDSKNLRRSSLLLFEDDHLLPFNHSVHDDIIIIGYGRYSHWGGGMFFSTSDGSNPNTNGRTYCIVWTEL